MTDSLFDNLFHSIKLSRQDIAHNFLTQTMENKHMIEACNRFYTLCDGNAAEEFFEANYSELRYTVIPWWDTVF